MPKGGKPVNYRSGDRSELMGATLLQMICAVAQVPRQEDWGMFDAIATLLNEEDGLYYAEESFLVQFKGRSVPHIDYEGRKFRALLNQELSLLVGQVDLRDTSISLYSLAPVLANPNVFQAENLRVYLGQSENPRPPKEGWFVAQTGIPTLRWSSGEMEDPGFRKRAHDVLQRWLQFDRSNRHLRKFGKQAHVGWETNEVPTEKYRSSYLTPAIQQSILEESVPAIQTLTVLTNGDAELLEAIGRIINWMRDNGVDADPGNLHALPSVMAVYRNRINAALAKYPQAHAAISIVPEYWGPDGCVIWIFDSKGVARKRSGTLDELREEGYVFELDNDGIPTAINLGKRWQEKRNFEVLAQEAGVFVLKRNG